MVEEITKKTDNEISKKSEELILKERKEKIKKFFTRNYNLISYAILAVIVFLTVRIRTSNLGGLKDITTGDWALGPDLDPWLFLRWAKYIVENGSLMAMDYMRYVPLGYDTKAELILHPYMIAWFHQVLVFFGLSNSVTYSAIIYPVFFWALTVIIFFLLTKKIFEGEISDKKANIIALIASFFLAIMPEILPRTIAGIPEKESAGFFFLFASFYFFISSWKEKKDYKKYILSVLTGLSTGAMALVWGGVSYIFLTIAPATFIAFLIGKVGKKEIICYALWLISAFLIMHPFSIRYGIEDLVSSIDTGIANYVLFIILTHFLLFETKLKHKLKIEKFNKVPPAIFSTLLAIFFVFVVISLVFGPSFFSYKLDAIINNLIVPTQNRLGVTVAENRQPYFTEWARSFGPDIKNIPVTFWLFFFGSILWVYNSLVSLNKKDKLAITIAYAYFIVAIIFSRYSSNSTLNGTNSSSILFYASGFVVLIGFLGYYQYKYYKLKEEDKLKQINIGFLVMFTFFFLGLISARGGVRVIMMLVPSVSILVAYLLVSSYEKAMLVKKEKRIIALGAVFIIGILTLYAGYVFYQSTSAQAKNHVPSIYNQQWQKAMKWVRDNTPQNAVFGHWWDYGYWLQSIGERATVLDGGNAKSFWNHMMGRYALTGTNMTEALEFLYAHNTTHFLIDSTDIGKYSAFSSIGSDVNYDRASYIPTFLRDPRQIQEKKNSTVFVYTGGSGLDEDIVYGNNETKIFLPAGMAGLGAVLIEKDLNGTMVAQPIGIFVYRNTQYRVPFRFAYDSEGFKDFGTGIESGIFIYPSFINTEQGIKIDYEGAMLYLSKRTVKSNLARFYLYKEKDPNFVLVHSEDDFLVAQIKAQNPQFDSDFIYYGGLRGPIRIWEIRYPEDIKFKDKYISTYYPPELREVR